MSAWRYIPLMMIYPPCIEARSSPYTPDPKVNAALTITKHVRLSRISEDHCDVMRLKRMMQDAFHGCEAECRLQEKTPSLGSGSEPSYRVLIDGRQRCFFVRARRPSNHLKESTMTRRARCHWETDCMRVLHGAVPRNETDDANYNPYYGDD